MHACLTEVYSSFVQSSTQLHDGFTCPLHAHFQNQLYVLQGATWLQWTCVLHARLENHLFCIFNLTCWRPTCIMHAHSSQRVTNVRPTSRPACIMHASLGEYFACPMSPHLAYPPCWHGGRVAANGCYVALGVPSDHVSTSGRQTRPLSLGHHCHGQLCDIRLVYYRLQARGQM